MNIGKQIPIVYFDEVIGIRDVGTGMVYILGGVTEHHTLSSTELKRYGNIVTTSLVQRVESDDKEWPVKIETLNTLYVRR